MYVVTSGLVSCGGSSRFTLDRRVASARGRKITIAGKRLRGGSEGYVAIERERGIKREGGVELVSETGVRGNRDYWKLTERGAVNREYTYDVAVQRRDVEIEEVQVRKGQRGRGGVKTGDGV